MTRTNEPLDALRKELNANRAFYRETMIRQARGASKATTILKAQICKEDSVILRNAIKKIKNIKPVYKWIKPNGYE